MNASTSIPNKSFVDRTGERSPTVQPSFGFESGSQRTPSIKDVVAQQPTGALGVLVLDRTQDGAMLVIRPRLPIEALPCCKQVARAHPVQIGNRGQQAGQGARRGEGVVKAPVGGFPDGDVGLTGTNLQRLAGALDVRWLGLR